MVKAAEFGEIQYNSHFIDYSKVNKESTKKLADFYFNKAINEKNKKTQSEYLQKASGDYFVWTQIEQDNIYPIVQMARIYDLENILQEKIIRGLYIFITLLWRTD